MNKFALKDQVYVCAVCGMASLDSLGTEKLGPKWDECCLLSSILCHIDSLEFTDSRITKAVPVCEEELLQDDRFEIVDKHLEH